MYQPTSTDHPPRACLLHIATLLFFSIASLPALAGEVSLGVAANFTDTTRELAKQFEGETGHTVSASFGSTGKLYAQIRNGAPFDVFMAADARRPALIEKAQAGVPNTRFTYARGKLVLWSPTPGAFGDAESYLAQQAFSRLAMANPKTAPYGLAAQQVLEHLGHWQALQAKLVRGDSIAQAFQFVVSRNAQAGFVALSQVTSWDDKEGTLWNVPQDYYQPIDQQAILLNRGISNEAALAWMDFLKSNTAIAIIRGHGYDPAYDTAD
ncbi:molybdate ABC transporter substrate-binding protein [Marinobacter algicola]|uniref:Molybdenum ABC transporter, substrate binding periplasmic protein (ModA) n=1 Tax=Marinobacter algicola DG893 TaxID=443152 RepID=A6F0G4_9GAMM|nr:molybdate ABC transporter substrate-binding protein [Marinobacter algicola]EDM47725.1 molybdenum ABC transporter, substrate binding periplasmic protein (ModA) [Marinobacter algicola DG893]